MTHVVRKPAPSSQRLKQLGQYDSSLDHRGYYYAELAVFFPSVGRSHRYTTHCAYPRRDGQAELTWVAGSDLHVSILGFLDLSYSNGRISQSVNQLVY